MDEPVFFTVTSSEDPTPLHFQLGHWADRRVHTKIPGISLHVTFWGVNYTELIEFVELGPHFAVHREAKSNGH